MLHQAEIIKRAALTKAVGGNAEQIFAFFNGANTLNVVAITQADAANTASRTSECTRTLFGKADRLTLLGCNKKLTGAVGENNVEKLVALVESECNLTALALVFIFGKLGSLDNTVSGYHSEVMGIGELVYADARGNLFPCFKLENIDNILSACGASCLGNHIRLTHLNLTRVGEHQQIRVTVNGNYLFDKVFFLSGHTDNTTSAAVLRGIGCRRLTLDVTCIGERDNTAVTLNQVLKNDFVLGCHNIGATGIGILAANFVHFILDDLLNLAHIGKDALEFFDQSVQASKFFFNLASFHTRQLTKCHFNNGLRLNVGQSESFHQGQFGRRNGGRGLHNLHDFIDVVKRDLVALIDVCSCLCFFEIELSAANDNLLLMSNVVVENLRQVENLWLVVNKCEHIDSKGILQLGVFVELIEKNLRVDVAAIFHNNAHTVSARFVAQLGNTLDLLFLYAVCNRLAKQALVNAVGNFGKDDASVIFFDGRASANHNVSLACFICQTNAVNTVNGCIGGEIGTFDVFHQVVHRALGVIHTVDGSVNYLTQVVRRNIGCHTNRNTHRAVYQQIGETGREYRRLLQTVIEVGHHRNDVLIKIAHHFIGNLIKTRFGITVCSCAVTVNRTKVSVSLNQRIAHREVLRHTNHCAVNSRVTVRVIATEYVTNGGCRLAEGLGMYQTILVHCIKNTASTGLHAVAHVGECARHNNRHRVFDKGFFNLLFHTHVDDFLIFEQGEFLFFF